MILKNLFTVSVFTTLMFAASAFVQHGGIKNPRNNKVTDNNGFAVLELFTSEGCSSCPPADELMGQIEKEYKDQPVYILTYHVDYWNRLGWKDRFSSAENSKRQQTYSQMLKSQTYTPQLVVNGKTELVGSDRNAVQNAIQNVLLNSTNKAPDLSAVISQKTISVNYKTAENDAQSLLLFSLIEKKSSTDVAAGENGGHRLHHWQILHKQEQILVKDHPKGTVTFRLPENFSPDHWEIIAFIQNPKTGKISGASKTLIQ